MYSSGMFFVVSSALSTCTLGWTSALTVCKHSRTLGTSVATIEHWCGMLWQDEVPVPEESGGRPRRAGRSAQAKSTMAKLGAPKAVGLPKPPQTLAKVRDLVFVCLHCLLACRRSEEDSYVVTSTMWSHVMLWLTTNRGHVVLWMPVGWGRWELARRHSHRRRNERTTSMTLRLSVRVLPTPQRRHVGLDLPL